MNLIARRTAAGLAATLALVACGQPREPLTVGIREVPNDIVLGGGETEAPSDAPPPPPLPPTPVVISAPVVVPPPARPRFTPPPRPPATPSPTPTAAPTTEPPVASPTPSPSPSPVEACPEDDPLEAPAFEARRDFAVAPAEEELAFRNDGSFSISGADANEGVFRDDTLRTVTEVETSEDSGDFTFDVVAELGGSVTTSTYRAVNDRPVDGLGPVLDTADVDDDRGLYLVRTETAGPDGSTSSFAPVPELLLLPFPSTIGDTFSAAATDPTSGVSMSYSAAVGDTVRINACGTPVQGVEVVLTDGHIVGPDQNVDFSARYVFATQYGGLAIEDEFTIAGTEAGQTSSRTNLATINVVPAYGPDAPEAEPSPSPTETSTTGEARR